MSPKQSKPKNAVRPIAQRTEPDAAGAGKMAWRNVDASGATLNVRNFLTTQFAQTSNLLRRTITIPYATQYGLSVAQWRILALLADSPGIPFSDLVDVSASDKALVSRTMGSLVVNGLATMVSLNPARPKRVACTLTPKGKKLFQQVMPIAQRSQAQMLLTLTPSERESLLRALLKLRAACAIADDT